MTRLQSRQDDLKRRQHRRRMLAVQIGEIADPKAWAWHLTVFCRLGRKRRAVEDKMIRRGEELE